MRSGGFATFDLNYCNSDNEVCVGCLAASEGESRLFLV